MKKIFLAFVMLAGSLVANAGILSLGKTNFEVVEGGTVVIPIQVDFDAQYSNIANIQNVECKVLLSNANFSMASVTTATARRSTGGAYQEEVAGATVMSVCKSVSKPFVGKDGDFFMLTIDASMASAGETCTLTIYDALCGYFDLTETNFTVSPDPLTATITVVDYVAVDENETFVPFSKSGAKVKVIRSFTAGSYATVCFPFALNATNAKAIFGNDVEIYEFSGVTYNASTESLQLSFGTRTNMLAATPYIVKPSASVSTDYTFASISLSDKAAQTVSKTEEDVTLEDINFKGNFTKDAVVPTGSLYLMSDGNLYSSTGAVKMKATRAYFDLTGFLAEAGISFVKEGILDLDGVLTSIDALDADENAADAWFDLNGRKLGAKPAAKGIYINNGKKVVVK